MKGINNSQEDAEQIAYTFNNRDAFEIKLMPLVKDSLREENNTTNEDVDEFYRKLLSAGVNIPIRIRQILGKNIESGCGNTYNKWAEK